MTEFSPEELARYSRHLILPEFNLEGQRRLKEAKVLVVGSGGLGSPLLLYLAAAGVGTIGVVDFDTVDISNLQRQVLFTVADAGKSKAETAKERLQALNPHIHIEVHNTALTSANALEIIRDYDVVADGTDNFQTRYLVNDACVLLDKVNVYGSIFRFEGQVSVFNYLQDDGERGPNYRDIFPSPPPPGMVPSCAEGGVLGVLPGIIGSLQANEVIKVITGIGEPLAGRLFLFDAASFTSRTLNLRRDPENPLTGDHPTQTGLIDYDEFCGLPKVAQEATDLAEITVQELAQWRAQNKEHLLIDVREPYEAEIATLGGILIPQGEVNQRLSEIPRDVPVVMHCRSGKRSEGVIKKLEQEHQYTNLINLKGGILAWSEHVDASVPKY